MLTFGSPRGNGSVSPSNIRIYCRAGKNRGCWRKQKNYPGRVIQLNTSHIWLGGPSIDQAFVAMLKVTSCDTGPGATTFRVYCEAA